MQQIASIRSRVWFSIAFKRASDRGSQIQQVAVFHWRQRTRKSAKETTAARTEHAG